MTPNPTTTPWQPHTGPGRRFATGTTKADHITGLFGFLAHAVLFFGLGCLICILLPDWALCLVTVALGFAGVLLVVRGSQVGLTTTRESVAAIREAWREKR